jgi:hypothetical protein
MTKGKRVRPLQTVIKLVFYYYHTVSKVFKTRSLPVIWDRKGEGVRRCILYRPREQEMVSLCALTD